MSDNPDSLSLEYRKFVASVAKRLTVEEIYEVACIWLKGTTDISVYEPTDDNKARQALGLRLFTKMDCLGIFSWTELDKLLEIVKTVNRYDLVDEVKSFMKKKGKSAARRYTKRKNTSKNLKEEREQLENTYDNLITRSLDLERHMRELRTVLRETDLNLDDGLEAVQKAEVVAQSLADDLNKDLKSLQGSRSRASSSASSGSDGSSDSRRNSRTLEPVPESTYETVHYSLQGPIEDLRQTPTNSPAQVHHQHHAVPNRDKPLPKPRSPKPPLRHPTPAQESKETPSEFVLPPRRPGLTHVTTVPSKPAMEEEEDDCTGDSGMGTGSGSAQYGGIEEWRRAMKKPPPVPEKPKVSRSSWKKNADSEGAENLYTPLREGTKDCAVHSYQGLKRGSPLF